MLRCLYLSSQHRDRGLRLYVYFQLPTTPPHVFPHAGVKSRGFRLIPYSLLFSCSAPIDEDLYAIASLHLPPILPLSPYPCDTSSVHSPPAAGDVSCTSCCSLVCNSNDDARDRICRSLPRIPRTTKTATQTCSAEPSGQFAHRIDDPHRT
jgi:hypothetical protein